MIAGCIEKMRNDGCGDCAKRDLCASLFAMVPRRAPCERPRTKRREFRRPEGRRTPFFAFLSEIAKALGEAEKAKRSTKPALFSAEVERQIEPLLASQDIRIEKVATALGLSRQTLYRRLKAEGVTFEGILDRLRRRLALRLIRDENLAVKEVAYRLGFSDPSAFSRAYKRWTGSSPRGPAPIRGAGRLPPQRSGSSANWR